MDVIKFHVVARGLGLMLISNPGGALRLAMVLPNALHPATLREMNFASFRRARLYLHSGSFQRSERATARN